MHRHTTAATLFLTIALTLGACGGTNERAAAPNAPAQSGANQATPSTGAPGNAARVPAAEVVRVSAAPVEVSAGGDAVVEVKLVVAESYHVNANPPTHKYLIPTTLDTAPEPGLSYGASAYPPPLTRKFAFDPQPLAVYEGEVTLRLPLRATRDAVKGARTLRAKVRAQPCDDQACYPPRTVETNIPLTIN